MSNICALMTDKSSCKLNLTARNTLLLKCLVRLVCVCACTFKGGGVPQAGLAVSQRLNIRCGVQSVQ